MGFEVGASIWPDAIHSGDVILTRDPDGVGLRMPPEFRQSGDAVEAEIAKIGAPPNRVREPMASFARMGGRD